MKNSRRRAVRDSEKLTPCECCHYPISQRHHLLNYAYHGENEHTMQLCANCHELYHLLYNKYVAGSKTIKLGKVINALGINDKRIMFLFETVMKVKEFEIQMSKQALEIINNEN